MCINLVRNIIEFQIDAHQLGPTIVNALMCIKLVHDGVDCILS